MDEQVALELIHQLIDEMRRIADNVERVAQILEDAADAPDEAGY